jgi:hypothetical protein
MRGAHKPQAYSFTNDDDARSVPTRRLVGPRQPPSLDFPATEEAEKRTRQSPHCVRAVEAEAVTDPVVDSSPDADWAL